MPWEGETEKSSGEVVFTLYAMGNGEMFLRLRLVESWVLGMYLNVRDSLGSILRRGFWLISTYSMLADK